MGYKERSIGHIIASFVFRSTYWHSVFRIKLVVRDKIEADSQERVAKFENHERRQMQRLSADRNSKCNLMRSQLQFKCIWAELMFDDSASRSKLKIYLFTASVVHL